MDAKRFWYWVTTAWVVGIMTITGGLSVAHAKTMMEGFAHLGYPAYFAHLLGVAKLLGACALLVPGFCANLCTPGNGPTRDSRSSSSAPLTRICFRVMASNHWNRWLRSQRWQCRIGRVRPIAR